MAWEVIFWLLCFAVSTALLGILVYQLISLSDLEFDYINPFDSSTRINKCVIPEFVIQGALSVLFLMTCRWFMMMLTAPLTYYHMTLYMKRRHFIDVTEIFRLLNAEKKYRMIKLGFYLSTFFIIIYRLVVSAVVALIEADDGGAF